MRFLIPGFIVASSLIPRIHPFSSILNRYSLIKGNFQCCLVFNRKCFIHFSIISELIFHTGWKLIFKSSETGQQVFIFTECGIKWGAAL